MIQLLLASLLRAPISAEVCVAASSISLTIALPSALLAPAAGEMIELQFCGGAHWCRPTRAQTLVRRGRDDDRAVLRDLEPGKMHTIWMRALISMTWTPLRFLAVCKTLAVEPGAAHHVRRFGDAPSADSLELEWEPPAGSIDLPAGYEVEYRTSSTEPPTLRVVAHARARLDGLRPGSHYAVRVRALFAESAAGAPAASASRAFTAPAFELSSGWRTGAWSTETVHRTSQAGVAALAALRFSERCEPGECEPDYLTNHDAADAYGEGSLLTLVAALPELALGVGWPHSTVTRYCVQRALPPAGGDGGFAAYVACNGVRSTEYTCTCALCADLQLARLPAGPECQNATMLMPSACDLVAGKRSVGRLDVFWPLWPAAGGQPLPARANSTSLGAWYSFPAEAECAREDDLGRGGCAWFREPEQQAIVRGEELIARGWLELRTPLDATLDRLTHNAAVLRALVDERALRCCGC